MRIVLPGSCTKWLQPDARRDVVVALRKVAATNGKPSTMEASAAAAANQQPQPPGQQAHKGPTTDSSGEEPALAPFRVLRSVAMGHRQQQQLSTPEHQAITLPARAQPPASPFQGM